MLGGKRRIRLVTLSFVILMAILLSFTTSVQAQYWPAMPPYNVLWPIGNPISVVRPIRRLIIPPYNFLWPLWSSALSTGDAIMAPVPLITEITDDTLLPVRPSIAWGSTKRKR